MAYDEALADRTRDAIGMRKGVTEKRMFGGVAFLLDGRMFCGVANDDLMVRVGPANHDAALAKPHVRPMDFTGRPMNGYVYVGTKGTKTVDTIRKWIELSTDFVETLPERQKSGARKRSSAAAGTRQGRGGARGQAFNVKH